MNLGLWGSISPKTVLGAIRRGASGVSDTTAPSVSTFTVTTPSTSRNIPVTAFTASEAGVSFLITENSTPPLPGAAGWEASAPTTYTVSADGAYTLYPWVKDTAGNVSAEFGSPRAVVVLALPFTDAFTRADGAIGGQWAGTTWTISSNAALNTPTRGAELAPDNTCTSTLTEADATTGWSPSSATLSSVTDNRPGAAGTKALNILGTAGGPYAGMAYTASAGTWVFADLWYKAEAGASVGVYDTSISDVLYPSATYYDTTWTNRPVAFRVGAGGTTFRVYSVNGQYTRWDDISHKPLTLASLFATLPSTIASVTAQVVVVVNPGHTQAGLVLNLDSISSPLNFVIAYLDKRGTVTAKLDKCVSGTYTNVISGTITFNAANNLKVVKSGDNYSLYYGTAGSEAQVGTTQAITNMNGTIHGLFSTSSTPKFDTYQLSATP